MKTIGLIGATGNVGGHLLALLAPHHRSGDVAVRVAVRSERAAGLVADHGLDAMPLQLERPEGLDRALAGVDTLFLLRPYSLEQLIRGKQVIDATSRAGVSAIVTVGAYGAQDTPWAAIGWNMLIEAYAERSGMSWTHLRPNFFMENLIAQYDPAERVIANRIVKPVSWIASRDIAAVAAAVLIDPAAHGGRIYSLAAEVADLPSIIALFETIVGTLHGVVAPPREMVLPRLLAQGREPTYAAALLDYVDAINAGKVPEAADTFDTVEAVAKRPRTTLRTFLQEALRG